MNNILENTNVELSAVQVSTDDEISSSQEQRALSADEFKSYFYENIKNDDGENVCLSVDIKALLKSEYVEVESFDVSGSSEANITNSCREYETGYFFSSTDSQFEYGFDIHFEEREQKSGSDIYCLKWDKWYVTRDVACSVNFVTRSPVPQGSKIRAMAMFSQPEYAHEAVSRCQDHMMKDKDSGVRFPEHFIRCESHHATYVIDPKNKVQSVVVPYEMPQRGQHYSTYIYKFVCFGSCHGLNKRPIKVHFQLEYQNAVIGLRSLDVKVCASPPRDYRNDCNPKKRNAHGLTIKDEPDAKKMKHKPINGIEFSAQKDEARLSISDMPTAITPDESALTFSPIPASNNWPGIHNFCLQIDVPECGKSKKKCAYSPRYDKLYIDKDALCQFTFTTHPNVPPDSKIRAMAIFTQPNHANEPVIRCFHHLDEDAKIGVLYADHVINCDSSNAFYEKNPINSRFSVVVPHGNFGFASTYNFKFVCYSSCPGGLNRRPIRVVFTLEDEKQVLGRRSLDVKICASPWRDFRNEEKKSELATTSPKDNKESTPGPSANQLQINSISPTGLFMGLNPESVPFSENNQRTPDLENQSRIITVYDRRLYQFLQQVQRLYKRKYARSHSGNIRKVETSSDSE